MIDMPTTQPELFKKCKWKSMMQSQTKKREANVLTLSRRKTMAESCYDCSGNDEKCERFAAEEEG